MFNRALHPVALFQHPAMPFFLIFIMFPTIWYKDHKNWTNTNKVTVFFSLKAEVTKKGSCICSVNIAVFAV